MIVVGGLDSIIGALLGAGIITAFPTVVPKILGAFVSSQQAATQSAAVSEIAYGLLVVIFVTSSPKGVVGWFASGKNHLPGLVGRSRATSPPHSRRRLLEVSARTNRSETGSLSRRSDAFKQVTNTIP